MFMRNLIALAVLSLLCACSTTKPLTPRAYLDEQTAATITVVADPVIFVADSSQMLGTAAGSSVFDDTYKNQDYLNLYGLDVNRMGTHRQYVAAMKWLVPRQSEDALPVLTLRIGTDTIELHATSEDAKQLGIAQAIAPSYSKTSKWWYFPTDAATLSRIAGAGNLSATLTLQERLINYTIFSDGRAQLAELTSGLSP